MKTKIELTEQEQSIIENALNAYWNDAHQQLENKGVIMSDGSKRSLGDIEKAQLEQRKELTMLILRRFENLY
tara:strand:+ start:379 stop:594 length:216 start_codon:yes stop_codon:yes gene_type:complete